MILIDDKLISDDVVKNHFVCNLKACKGACCYEGDYGAPLEKEEMLVIEEILEHIKPFLSPASVQKIEADGFSAYNKIHKVHETALMPDDACVFMGRDEIGITFCGIEKAYNAGSINFKKPISCHLYPVRVIKNEKSGFEALNYDRWDICNSACSNGENKKVRIFEFVKDALIRKYGIDFYEELEAAAENLG